MYCNTGMYFLLFYKIGIRIAKLFPLTLARVVCLRLQYSLSSKLRKECIFYVSYIKGKTLNNIPLKSCQTLYNPIKINMTCLCMYTSVCNKKFINLRFLHFLSLKIPVLKDSYFFKAPASINITFYYFISRKLVLCVYCYQKKYILNYFIYLFIYIYFP